MAELEVVYQGTRMSYARAKYLETQRNQTALRNVNALAAKDARDVLIAAGDLERMVYGGYARKVMPALVDKWGNVNGAAAVAHYNAMRDLWYQTKDAGSQSYARSTRYAAAATRGAIYKATLPKFDATALADPIVGQLMAAYTASGSEASISAAQNALTRQIGAYNRDTMLFNAGLDPMVAKVQRVAERTACAFCVRMAFKSYRGGAREVRTTDYAVHWHDHCNCSIEVLYEGDAPIRPDYYDDFEREIDEADSAPADDPRFDTQRSLNPDATTKVQLRRLIQDQRAISGRS